jgi:Asp/Glu/hydantoin racemase
MPKIAIIHTAPVTVDAFKALTAEILPDAEVVNFLDDSILPQLRQNGGNVGEVEDRLLHYAQFAQNVGADIILSACSSVGEVAAKMREQVSVPVVRVDDAMAEEAVRRGNVIGVAATLWTTLRPTMELIQSKADEAGKTIELRSNVVDAAFQRLSEGDKEGHDAILAETLAEMAVAVDVVVLAQASMARVVSRLPEGLQSKFLTSPRLAVERVKAELESVHI